MSSLLTPGSLDQMRGTLGRSLPDRASRTVGDATESTCARFLRLGTDPTAAQVTVPSDNTWPLLATFVCAGHVLQVTAIRERGDWSLSRILKCLDLSGLVGGATPPHTVRVKAVTHLADATTKEALVESYDAIGVAVAGILTSLPTSAAWERFGVELRSPWRFLAIGGGSNPVKLATLFAKGARVEFGEAKFTVAAPPRVLDAAGLIDGVEDSVDVALEKLEFA